MAVFRFRRSYLLSVAAIQGAEGIGKGTHTTERRTSPPTNVMRLWGATLSMRAAPPERTQIDPRDRDDLPRSQYPRFLSTTFSRGKPLT
jgi:hypothetical protein